MVVPLRPPGKSHKLVLLQFDLKYIFNGTKTLPHMNIGDFPQCFKTVNLISFEFLTFEDVTSVSGAHFTPFLTFDRPRNNLKLNQSSLF